MKKYLLSKVNTVSSFYKLSMQKKIDIINRSMKNCRKNCELPFQFGLDVTLIKKTTVKIKTCIMKLLFTLVCVYRLLCHQVFKNILFI